MDEALTPGVIHSLWPTVHKTDPPPLISGGLLLVHENKKIQTAQHLTPSHGGALCVRVCGSTETQAINNIRFDSLCYIIMFK